MLPALILPATGSPFQRALGWDAALTPAYLGVAVCCALDADTSKRTIRSETIAPHRMVVTQRSMLPSVIRGSGDETPTWRARADAQPRSTRRRSAHRVPARRGRRRPRARRARRSSRSSGPTPPATATPGRGSTGCASASATWHWTSPYATALIFVAITAGTPEASGWAIPAATDIAFAVGVLALLGDRVSVGVKLFVLTIAIVDDILAILIIAFFFAGDLSLPWLAAGAAGVAAVIALRRLGVARIAPYLLLGIAIWIAVHESGVHATIAGVALGLLTPTGVVGGRNVLELLEHRLHAVSAFVIVPLFALANAGVSLDAGVLTDAANSRVAWAIAAGLVLGKLLGITGATFLGLRLGIGTLPAGVSRGQVWGVAAIGGVGFTVSLFIAQLAYDDPQTIDLAKVGIFAGSILSGVLGALLLVMLADRNRSAPPAPR